VRSADTRRFDEAGEPIIWLFVARRHVDYGRLHSTMCPVG
jgi:hypothetical protein